MRKIKAIMTPLRLYLLLLFILTLTLGYFCVWTQDDFYTNSGGWIASAQEALFYGNGRYLGNFLVNVCLSHKLLDSVVRGAVITGIIGLLPSVAAELNLKTLSMSFLLFFGFSNLILREAVLWGHGFYNFALPALCILVSLQILKSYYIKKKTARKGVKIAVLLILGVCQQLFSENTTCVALLIALALFLITVCRKEDRTLTLAYLAGAALGAFIMFALPEIMQVSHKMEFYRGSGVGADSLGEFIRLIFRNLNSCLFSLCPMVPVWTAVSIGFIRIVRAYSGNSRRLYKRKPFFYAVFALQPLFSVLFFFIDANPDEGKSRLSVTQLSNIYLGIFIFFIIYCAALLFVVLVNEQLRGNRKLYLAIIGVGVCSVGELLIITVMGPRCLFLTACIIAVFVLRFFSEENLLGKKTAVASGAAGVLIAVYLIVILIQVTQVSKARFTYAKQQMDEKKQVIEIILLPHARWLHIPNKTPVYGYYFNYGEVKDESDYEYITYDEYLNRMQP